MFVRVKNTPNSPRQSVQLVANYRKDGKVRQRIVRHVGIAHNDKELKRLKDLAELIKAEMAEETQPSLFKPEEVTRQVIASRERKEREEEELNVNLKKLREVQRITVGIHDVFGSLYEELGLRKVISESAYRKVSSQVLKDVVLARIASPDSKRSTVRELNDSFGINIPLQSVYRMMDFIDDRAIKRLNNISRTSGTRLFGEDVDVLFYDVTTLYFESFTEDDLKRNGYSKDLKFNQPQVLLTLIVTREGIPLGYEVFPGSTFEGDTLKVAIKQIRSSYNVKNLVFVADAAMLSKKNMDYLEEEGVPYIVGARLKNTSNALKAQILDKSNYKGYSDDTYSTGELYNQVADLEYSDGRRLITVFSKKRAAKDAHDREKALDKLQKKLSKSTNPLSLVSSYGYKRFLKPSEAGKVLLDEEKVNKAAKWDGLHGVVTNIKDMTPEEIRERYHGLWQVEETFRISKTDLKIRPIYHWTPARIKAHIAICFMSLTLLRHIMYRAKLQFKAMSAKEIKRHLKTVQITILKDTWTNKRYGIPSNHTHEATKLYQIMGKKISPVPFEIL